MRKLFKELSDPMPSDFLALSRLDSANAAQREGAKFAHPFDSTAGKQQLERWLSDHDEEHFGYAVSAAAALPFISAPERDTLLGLAFGHPSAEVRLEAAWAAGKLGRDAGIEWLTRACLDVSLAEQARQYLTELGRADAIPAEAEDAGFRAKAEFAQWLAHPNELGRLPDELEIVDHRELQWPPEREPKQLWLIKYRVRDVTGLEADDVGVGLVGSVTFCLFSYKLEQRPPEDCYGLHCYWEMTCHKLIGQISVDENSTKYDEMLQQCRLDGLGPARIVLVVKLSKKLQYPQKLVGLAKATREGQPGWVVLDGPRSRWYAASELPTETHDKTVVMVHVGRVLLGFMDEPDRRRYLQPAPPPQTPEQIITAYERILNKASSNPKLLDSFSPLGEAFDSYVDALIELNRQADVPALLEKFRPHWAHNLGYGKLGTAAFKSGHEQIAESFFVKLRRSMPKDWCRSDESGFLAQIWKRQGRSEEAHTLLIDALKGLQEQSRAATGSDRKLFEEWFQTRRSTYLQLFPERGDDELGRHGIASSTLAG
jgi:hypothetical protein